MSNARAGDSGCGAAWGIMAVVVPGQFVAERTESTPIRLNEQEGYASRQTWGHPGHSVCTVFAGGDSHGKVRREGVREGGAGDARTKARDVEVGPLREKGHEPKAGHRHRFE